MSQRRRLDKELVRLGLAADINKATDLISQGKVLVGGAPALNSNRMVAQDETLSIVAPPPQFVSRGGEKLKAAIENFSIDVANKRVLDVGASTGGFTDCLLQYGASSVVGIDVGYGQLHEYLRSDPRVEIRDRTNIRFVTQEDFPDLFEVITVDVSFISLVSIASVVAWELALPGADVIVLIKPQFEATKSDASKWKGVIKDPAIWEKAIQGVLDAMRNADAVVKGVMVSPLLGVEGNVEFLAWMRAHAAQTGENSVNVNMAELLEVAEALSREK